MIILQVNIAEITAKPMFLASVCGDCVRGCCSLKSGFQQQTAAWKWLGSDWWLTWSVNGPISGCYLIMSLYLTIEADFFFFTEQRFIGNSAVLNYYISEHRE